MLVVFVVLGIAADNFFVFYEGWKMSKHIKVLKGNKKLRMAYAFKRAVRAISITTSTTCAAFFANSFSNIMPIRAFGIYAGLIILVNFVLISLMFPPMVIF
jgi:predicted RND superfamily exporter protein